MFKRKFMVVFILMLVIGFSPVYAQRQRGETPPGDSSKQDVEELRKFSPSVFIDCRGCDRDFFREEITYINYVRDRKDADVHVLITDQSTGSGGREYTFAFIGLREYEGLDYTLVFASGPTDTRDEIRRGQVEVLRRGLFPYVLKTPIAEYIFLNFRQRLEPTSVVDPWKFWVFSISADGRLSGESTRSSKSLEMNLSANKVTPDIKIRIGLSADFDERTYEYDSEELVSTQDEKDLTTMVVKSISDHWSVGGYFEAESSTYGNLDYMFTLAPAIEFNVFPYSESTRRQLRFLYKIGWNRADYIEETIYEKTEETLFNQSLTIALSIREQWGTATASVEGSHYFHDPKKYRVVLGGFLDVRLFKGFSLDIWGRYGRIRDQLALPVGEATFDEILLRRKELATNYDYSLSVGLRYTFGSVYSNVVNPRFGEVRMRGFRR